MASSDGMQNNALIVNTIDGLTSLNTTSISIDNVPLTPGDYVPYMLANATVDLNSQNIKTTHTALSQYDLVNLGKLQTDYLPYVGSNKETDLGAQNIKTSRVPTGIYDLTNKLYVDNNFPTFSYVASNYLTQTNAASTYLTQTNAASTYLTQFNASLTYQTQAGMPSFNFTGSPTVASAPSAVDDSDKIPTTHWVNYAMSLVYLPITTAATTYLTITNASSTYATITNLNLKADSASPTFTGTVTLPSTVNFSSAPSSGTGTLLAINGSGNLITTTSTLNQTSTLTSGTYYLPFVASSSTGAFIPLVYPTLMCNPNTGLLSSSRITASVQMETYSMKITNVPTGTQTFLLAVDSAGNVIQGTSAGGVTSFSAGSTGFLPNSSTTGAITLSGNLNVANGGTGATTTTGTAGANVLSVSPALTGTPTAPTAGVGTNTTQIATTEFVTTAVSAVGTPTQINATTVNTSVSLYPAWFQSTAGGVSTVYVESDGSLFYNPSTNRLTSPIINAPVVETSAIQNSSGQIININAQGGAIAGNRLNLQIQSTTYYYFDKDAFYLTQPVNNVISSILNDLYILWPSAKLLSLNNWVQIDNTGLLMAGTRPVFTQNVTTQATTDLNINVPTATNLCNFIFNGTTSLSINSTGLRPPSGTLNVIYSSMPTINLTDGTNSTTIVSYAGGCEFRTAGTTRLGFDATGMYVNNIRNISGVNLDINGNGAGIVNLQSYGNNVFQTNATGCRVTASSGSLVFSNTANIQTDSDGFNWYIGGASQVGYFDKNAWATGYGWRIHANTFTTYECAYDMTIQCKTGGVPQYGANNRMINVITPNSINSPNDIAGSGWYCGAIVFRSENGGNQGDGIGISMSSGGNYGGNNWGYVTCVNPGVAWRNWAFSGATAQWYVNGTACAYINSTSGWQAASDERCKRDINDLNTKKSLQRVLKCKPKHYKRILKEPKGENPIPLKQEDIDRVHIGLLAQEVLEYNPHCVSTWEDDAEDGKKVERLGLAYQDFIIHLIGSVQEQQKQIEEQRQAINTLTESMKTLTEHLSKLTTAFNEITKK